MSQTLAQPGDDVINQRVNTDRFRRHAKVADPTIEVRTPNQNLSAKTIMRQRPKLVDQISETQLSQIAERAAIKYLSPGGSDDAACRSDTQASGEEGSESLS
jgi:hypothetical protein